MINSSTYYNNKHLEAPYQQSTRAGVGWWWSDAAAVHFAGINISFASTCVADKRDSENLPPQHRPEGLQVPNKPNEYIFHSSGRKLEQLEQTHTGRQRRSTCARCLCNFLKHALHFGQSFPMFPPASLYTGLFKQGPTWLFGL